MDGCVPPDAVDVFLATNKDSLAFYVAYRFLPGHAESLQIGSEEAAPNLVHYRAPRKYSWWDDAPVQAALSGKGPKIWRCGDKGRASFVVDEVNSRGYAWWVVRGPARPHP